MRVLLAFDKFKGALSAVQACAIAAKAIGANRPGWHFDRCSLTDGGEGFVEILTAAAGGELRRARVAGPRGQRVTAKYGLVRADRIPRAARAMLELPRLPAGARIAIVEMAQASGLALLEEELRDPWRTSTYGTGQLIRSATAAGARAVLLGVGGSATHDLGLGALSALGVGFQRADGRAVRSLEPIHWPGIACVTDPRRVPGPPIRIACDVTNPLLGPRGAAKIYAPQKGLRPRDYRRLERESARMAALLCRHYARPASLLVTPGTGAAGGLSFGLMCARQARLLPGFELIAAWLDLKRRLAAADVVITGEGRFDQSSFNGKGPGSVVRLALALGKTVHVFAGRAAGMRRRPGFQVHTITPRGQALATALRNAGRNLGMAVRRLHDTSGHAGSRDPSSQHLRNGGRKKLTKP